MNEAARFRIERNNDAKDGLEVTKKSSGDYVLEVSDDVNLEKDDDVQELFAEKFNKAYRGIDFEKMDAVDFKNRLNVVEIKRLGASIKKGEDRHSYRIPKDSSRR
ncbi:MAG: hypothetical protein U9O20_00070 [Patescibacteria group bacterium]|nr:hypothetical protein [Patescibacteria group bacterium]